MSPDAVRALLAGLVVGLLAGLWIGAQLEGGELGDVGDLLGTESSASDEALEVIEASYFKPVEPDQLEDASIRGMVRELRDRYDDRFSHYFDPKQLRQFEQATSGSFSGVGLSVREVKSGLRVTTVFDDTPAKRAGIREGDEIVAVDGRSIAGEPADVATGMIKGPPGTTVELRVRRPGGATREIELERAQVRVPVVTGQLRRADGHEVAYVQLAGFSEGAHGELRQEIERLDRKGAEGLVLDLRGNGGGLLNEAVLTSSVFVEDGVIVSTSGRNQPEQDYDAVGNALEPRPTVVLINRDTASAAEILASALGERDLATIVGTRSFGKGVFQEVIELDSGGAIDLTVGEYLTSEGRSLAGKGIPPEVRARDELRTPPDEALQRGLEVLGRELGAGG
ncbi:MAG TPA: S41 family peptidase [Solirubrobacterales bacterium]|nr:S41 family peptidase [Solirubrobacterales bacterium]